MYKIILTKVTGHVFDLAIGPTPIKKKKFEDLSLNGMEVKQSILSDLNH